MNGPNSETVNIFLKNGYLIGSQRVNSVKRWTTAPDLTITALPWEFESTGLYT